MEIERKQCKIKFELYNCWKTLKPESKYNPYEAKAKGKMQHEDNYLKKNGSIVFTERNMEMEGTKRDEDEG